MLPEEDLVRKLESALSGRLKGNLVKAGYYEGSVKPHWAGLTVPPALRGMAPRLGWAGVVVDALDERIGLLGWNDPSGALGLDLVFNSNCLDGESGLCHLDALMFGVGFVTVGTALVGEPDPLVTVQSALGTTGLWDARSRRLSCALTLDPLVKGEPPTGTLYLPDETVWLEKFSGSWVETDRDRHGLGRVPVVMMANRTSASRREGQSEISAPVRDLVDEAARVLLSMAVNREFFSSPQRIVLGAAPDAIDKWKYLTTGLWTIEADGKGETPTVTQFPAVSPGSHIEQLRTLAMQLAAAAGIPDAYLGVATAANPASADAIRAAEVRLIKKAERRAQMFGAAWLEVARLALLVRDGVVPEEFARVSCRWADPATPTRAAKADEAAKLVGANVLPARSQVTLDRIGLTPAEQAQIEADWAANPSAVELMARSMAA
ncbi:MAG: phage portal protein [Propionibacteriaceae bacterium]|jgi:hypothetical protein|nr:phage portal protein [Propionibacteriaceae bacterium]